jgi:hypothetical protein
LRTATDGLPNVSTYTIWRVLHEAGWAWQADRAVQDWYRHPQTPGSRGSEAIEAEAKKLD